MAEGSSSPRVLGASARWLANIDVSSPFAKAFDDLPISPAAAQDRRPALRYAPGASVPPPRIKGWR